MTPQHLEQGRKSALLRHRAGGREPGSEFTPREGAALGAVAQPPEQTYSWSVHLWTHVAHFGVWFVILYCW